MVKTTRVASNERAKATELPAYRAFFVIIATAKVVKRGKGEAFWQIIYGFYSKIFRPNASPLLALFALAVKTGSITETLAPPPSSSCLLPPASCLLL